MDSGNVRGVRLALLVRFLLAARRRVTKKPANRRRSSPCQSCVASASTRATDLREKVKVVLLDFWATWCGAVHQRTPEPRSSAASLPPDVVVVRVSIDHERKNALIWRRRLLTFKLLHDPAGQGGGGLRSAEDASSLSSIATASLRFVNEGFTGPADVAKPPRQNRQLTQQNSRRYRPQPRNKPDYASLKVHPHSEAGRALRVAERA